MCESSFRDNDLEGAFWGRKQFIENRRSSLNVIFKKKSNMIAGLEIADLICHTATRGCRNNLQGKKVPKDFEITFGTVDNRRKCGLIEIIEDSFAPSEM